MRRTVHVYTGPTLTAADVTAVLPAAVVHPPVAAGDLLTLDAARGDVVVIIDGYFQQAQAVRHKEILLLVERGIEVWGAASMGALRAAELHTLGMHGTGAVFHLYVRGVIEGDDEVGVTHGPAERGYPVVADALVNIRCTVRAAVRDGMLTAHDARVFTAAAAAMPFELRTLAGLLGAAREAGLGTTAVARIEAALTERRVDVKRRDALRALRRVRRSAARWSPPRIAARVSDNAHLSLWRESCGSDRQALVACQLFAPDYPEFAAPVALRILAALASPPPAEPRSDSQLLHQLAGGVEATLRAFLAAHDLDREALLRHLRREERLECALGGRPATPEVLAGIVLAAADSHGVLAAADAPRWEAHWLRHSEREGGQDRRLRAALRALAVPPGLAPREAFVVALKLAGRFAAAREAARAGLAFNDEVAAAHPEFAVHLIDGRRVAAWFAERWGVSAEDFDLELADRGFASRDEFLSVARAFYMADKFRPLNGSLSLGAAAA